MHKCKICGESIYQKINFTLLFKIEPKTHHHCIKKLVYNLYESYIPIDSNQIILDYVFERNTTIHDEIYFEFFCLGKLIYKHLLEHSFSIILYWDSQVINIFLKINPYLIFSLSSNPFIIISLHEIEKEIFSIL